MVRSSRNTPWWTWGNSSSNWENHEIEPPYLVSQFHLKVIGHARHLLAFKFTALILLGCSTWNPKGPTIRSATKLYDTIVSTMADTSYPFMMAQTYINPFLVTIFSNIIALTSCKVLTLVGPSDSTLFLSLIRALGFLHFGKLAARGDRHKQNNCS